MKLTFVSGGGMNRCGTVLGTRTNPTLLLHALQARNLTLITILTC